MARKSTAGTSNSLGFAESIINTVREPLICSGSEPQGGHRQPLLLRVLQSDSAGETIGKLIYDLGNRQWDIPKLRGRCLRRSRDPTG